MEKLAIMLKLISIVCFVMAGKKYAESRYYQGKVDARTEMDASLQQMIRNLGGNRGSLGFLFIFFAIKTCPIMKE